MLTVQMAPASSVAGRLELLYIPQGEEITGDDYPLPVTNEYAGAVAKYGTLADLFGKDGRGKNPEKAAYCQMRYDLAEAMAAIVLKGWT